MTDDRGFTSVTGKGFRQRDNLRFRYAALFAVLRQRELFCRLFQALQPALHRDPLAVGERNVLRHEKPCLSASGRIDQLAVGIQHDGGLFAIGRKMAQRQVLSGKRRQFIRNDQVRGVGPTLLAGLLHRLYAGNRQIISIITLIIHDPADHPHCQRRIAAGHDRLPATARIGEHR